jgi:hypothetical protein
MGYLATSDEEKNELRARAKRHGSQAVFYTTDFVLGWTWGVRAAVEVKLDRFPGDDQYQRKLKLAGNILQNHGVEFLRLVTPSNWRHPLRTNLPLLHQANKRRDIWPQPEIGDRIQALHEAGAKTMGDYLVGLGLDARMSPLLLVSGHLEANVVDNALCFATPASPAYGDLSHLQLFGRLAQ